MGKGEISVLIADDNVSFVKSVKSIIDIQDNMYIVSTACSGVEAIDKIKTYQPDIILLDIVMPKMDGISVLKNINMIQLSKIPVIFILTAVGQENFLRKAMLLGADYYFIKPFDLEILTKRINMIYQEKLN